MLFNFLAGIFLMVMSFVLYQLSEHTYLSISILSSMFLVGLAISIYVGIIIFKLWRINDT